VQFSQFITWSTSGAWIAFFACWTIMALRVKRVVKRQSAAGRLLQVLGALVAFLLMFNHGVQWTGVMIARFVPPDRFWAAAGAALTCIGVAIAIWARTLLGGNWSGIVTVKQDHTLIRTGPYGVVRHPIYSGLILALFGTALTLGEVRDLAAIVVVFLTLLIKSRTEERFMTEQFGREYEEYRRTTRALVPFVF
jgi:protein-S-isoprenylcysteine O-methyltransferase Ste14